MRAVFLRVWNDPFLRKSGVFFIGSMIVAVLNYLFYPVLGRHLSLADYGDVQASLSIWSQVMTLLGAFNLAVVHTSTNCDHPGECRAVTNRLQMASFVAVGIICVLLLLGSNWLFETFRFTTRSLLFVLPLLLIGNSMYGIRIGYLQGKGRFFSVSLANILLSGGRLVFALLLIVMGWRSFGALFGVLLSQILAISFVFWKTRHMHAVVDEAESYQLESGRMRRELMFVGLIVCSMYFVSSLYLTDVLFVKHYFSPELAGVYSGISTVANIAFFLTGPIITVMLSSLRVDHSIAQRRQGYVKALSLVCALGGGVVLAFFLFPTFIIRLLMGARYVSYAHLLPWLGAAFFCASLVYLGVAFGLVMRRKRLILLAACGISLLAFLMITRHASLDQIVQNFFICDLAAALGAFACAYPDLRQKSA